MSEEPLHERMAEYDRLAADAADLAEQRDDVGTEVSERLADAVSEAVTKDRVSIQPAGRSKDGHRYRFTARLDRAALVAALTDALPAGFVVSHVNDDGSLSVEWTGRRETPSRRERGALLKAIIAEEMVIDRDGLIESVPTRDRVLERAVELGLDEDNAAERLARLETLEVVDISHGEVFPDDNFSRY
mgnify:CR=1 FL=1